MKLHVVLVHLKIVQDLAGGIGFREGLAGLFMPSRWPAEPRTPHPRGALQP